MKTLPLACSKNTWNSSQRFSAAKIAVAIGIAFAAAPNAYSYELDTGSNTDLNIRWDNTFKYSNAWRLKEQSPLLISDPNLDDGDRAFNTGLISNRIDYLTELDLAYQNFGGRISGAAWYDSIYNQENKNNSPSTVNAVGIPNNQFTTATRKLMGDKAEVLDAFVYGKFDAGNAQTTVRLGQHSLLYGESLFFGNNGIANGTSPIDLIKALAVPNTQFKELLRPVPQISVQSQLNSNWAVGGYYQFKWEPDRLPPVDSYFSTADLVGPGQNRIFVNANPNLGPLTSFYSTGDISAKNSGQGGLQLRFRPDGGNTDYGFYLIRYNEKLPQLYVNPGSGLNANSPADMIGTYEDVYPEGITSLGSSFSTTLGTANVAGEMSFRENAPLVSHTGVVLPGETANNSNNPFYAVGRTAHAQVSMIDAYGKTAVWDAASFVGELAWNRTLSITKNPGDIDPNSTRDAVGLRFILEPSYYQVINGLDLGIPVGVGYTPYGRSSAVLGFGVDHGGDFSVGLDATYLSVWKITANLTMFYGKETLLTNTATDTRYFGQDLKDRNFISMSITRSF